MYIYLQLKLCQIEMKNNNFSKKKKKFFTIFSSAAITKNVFTYFIKINNFLYSFYNIN